MRLPRAFYARDTLIVAEELLGKWLVFGERRARIIETEAYLGPEDLASHARFTSRKRNHLMFAEAGHAYVYLTYGMHYLLNIIAKEEGKAGGVLLRAVVGIVGPAKLTQAFGITKEQSGWDLVEGPLGIEEEVEKEGEVFRIETGPRVGIDYAGEYRDKPWRFRLIAKQREAREENPV